MDIIAAASIISLIVGYAAAIFVGGHRIKSLKKQVRALRAENNVLREYKNGTYEPPQPDGYDPNADIEQWLVKKGEE